MFNVWYFTRITPVKQAYLLFPEYLPPNQLKLHLDTKPNIGGQGFWHMSQNWLLESFFLALVQASLAVFPKETTVLSSSFRATHKPLYFL
ncbi:hypothetical protein HY383_02700 [Candidatus Daviesbacteria bacterium]|nr:hypothetical protein [Candidatus Daviesbacteria bacterium]